jgi:hypothetical protein
MFSLIIYIILGIVGASFLIGVLSGILQAIVAIIKGAFTK